MDEYGGVVAIESVISVDLFDVDCRVEDVNDVEDVIAVVGD